MRAFKRTQNKPFRDVNRKEKGGSPEDDRQEVFNMHDILERPAASKKTPIVSSLSPEKSAALWLEEQILKAKIKVVTELVQLSPALARVLLDRNPDNRKISATVVENYARDMTNGAWAFNGEPIIVSDTGKLNDGQHRCEAVIASGVTLPSIIVIGPDRDSRLTVDQGKTRMTGDYLGMNGHIAANTLAAAANYIWQHQNHGYITKSPSLRPTKSEILAFVEKYPNIAQSVASIKTKGSDAVGGKPVLAFAHWTFTLACGTSTPVELFLDALINGSNLVARSPILYARNRLMAERGRINVNEKAELIIRAWNASRRGDKVASLPIKGGALPMVER